MLTEIVSTIGMQPTLELTRAWGGRTISIPAKMHEMHPIALTVGYNAALKLAAAYPGGRLEIPAERTILLELRNSSICSEYQQGESVSKLAERWGISRKMILKVLDRNSLRSGHTCKADTG